MPDLPHWARWNPEAARRPWTVGVEEEIMLLDGRTLSVANRVDDVLPALDGFLRSRVSAETHACVVELKTAPHPDVRALARELEGLRRTLRDEVRERVGLQLAAAGMHPLADRSEIAVSSDPRYREIEAETRAMARREPTMALHVHVAVPDGPAGVAALDGLRDELPLLLALSANSPFWRGRDSGFASTRIPVLSMFPRMGVARHFGTFGRYVEVIDRLLRSGVVPDPSFFWWDARLQPRLGTVEVRIMDAQTHVADVAALVALIQCRVRRHAVGPGRAGTGPEEVAENRFIASRDGMAGALVDRLTGRPRRAREALVALLDESRSHAAELGCVRELEAVADLAAHPGFERQRELAARGGLLAVLAELAGRYGAAPPVALTS